MVRATGIEVRAKVPLAGFWLPWFVPTVQIDDQAYPLEWGRQFFPVEPGPHVLLFSMRKQGRFSRAESPSRDTSFLQHALVDRHDAVTEATVQAGEVVGVTYRVPWLAHALARGRVRIEPASDHGMLRDGFPADSHPARLRRGNLGWKVFWVVLTAVGVAVRLQGPASPAQLTPPLTSEPTSVPGPPSGYSGPSYAGMIIQDHIANPAGQVQLFGTTATAANLRPAPSHLGGQLLCADVTLDNRSNDIYSYGPFRWALQEPDGTVGHTIDGTLSTGDLAPRSSIAGTVCFDPPARQGTYVLLWAADSSHVDRGVWLVPLAGR